MNLILIEFQEVYLQDPKLLKLFGHTDVKKYDTVYY